MSVAISTTFRVIRQRLYTQFVKPEGLESETDYDANVVFNPPANKRWCRLEIIVGESQNADFGSTTKRIRTVGIALVQLFEPMNSAAGDSELLRLAGVVASAFRNKTDSGVRFRVPSVSRLGRQGSDYQVNVSCPWWTDEFA